MTVVDVFFLIYIYNIYVYMGYIMVMSHLSHLPFSALPVKRSSPLGDAVAHSWLEVDGSVGEGFIMGSDGRVCYHDSLPFIPQFFSDLRSHDSETLQ